MARRNPPSGSRSDHRLVRRLLLALTLVAWPSRALAEPPRPEGPTPAAAAVLPVDPVPLTPAAASAAPGPRPSAAAWEGDLCASACVNRGRCLPLGELCVASSNAACRASRDCARKGRCTLDPVHGVCRGYLEGDPPPPGYQLGSRPHRGLVIAGTVTLSTLHLVSAVLGLRYGKPLLTIPVAGPLAQLRELEGGDLENFALGEVFFFDGVGQIAGLALLTAGLLAWEDMLVPAQGQRDPLLPTLRF
jgi:hypothetical protein